MATKILQAVGQGQPFIPVFPPPLLMMRAPNDHDTSYPQGQLWFDNSQDPPVQYTFDGDQTWNVGDTVPEATESVPGISQLATQAETNSGALDDVVVTPLKLKTAIGNGSYPGKFTNLQFTQGFVVSVNAKSASYTALATDYLIPVNSSGGAVIITLPAATAVIGQTFVIRDVGGQAGTADSITINGGGTNLVGGGTSAATKVLGAAYSGATVYSTGTVWLYAYVA